MAHRFLDGPWGELGMRGNHRPLVGVLAQHLYRRGELIARGVGACGEQSAREQSQFRSRQPVAVLLGADHVREQIVGEVLAPTGNHVVDVVLELQPGRHDGGLVVGNVPVEHLEDVVGPPGEQLPVLTGSAEQRADDRNRILPGDVCDHVAMASDDGLVDEFGDDVVDRGGQPGGRLRGEGLRHQLALPVVNIAVEAQQPVDDAVPQRARSHALSGQAEAARRREPGVAQGDSHQVVAQQLWSVCAHRDGSLTTGGGDAPVRLGGVVQSFVIEGRQCGGDGHGFLLDRVARLSGAGDEKPSVTARKFGTVGS